MGVLKILASKSTRGSEAYNAASKDYPHAVCTGLRIGL